MAKVTQKKLTSGQKTLIGIAIAFLAVIIYIPALNVFYQAFKNGVAPFFSNLVDPEFLSAVRLTVLLAIIAVPVNTIFGLCAAWAITRRNFWGRSFLLSVIDLPFSISPVVAGLMLVLVYGRNGWFGGFFEQHNIQVIFAFPGMVLATAFVSMPFVAREIIPVLEEAGRDQEEAAKTLGATEWQTFWNITPQYSLGVAVWRGADECTGDGRVWGGVGGVGQHCQ
jgi:sulfate/thiosulfate transport system permease protein